MVAPYAAAKATAAGTLAPTILIPVTNAIESLHMQVRKVIKNRGHFPNDEAASKLIYLALRNITRDWKMPPVPAGKLREVARPRRCRESAGSPGPQLRLSTMPSRYR